jgi:hypothetical protein
MATTRRMQDRVTAQVTPGPVTAEVTKGPASVVFFYYGDSKFLTLAQETLHLKKAMEDYNHVVLLKHDVIPEPFDLSSGDERQADVIEIPTQANLFKHLRRLASEGYMTDLWIFAHGSPGGMHASSGQHDAPSDRISPGEIETELGSAKTGFKELPIRMIWSTLCYGANLNAAWREAGAKVVSGSRSVNFYPNQFGKFAEQWNKGTVAYQEAIARSNTAASRALSQTYIATMDAPKTRGEYWDGCSLGRSVLGNNPCAKDYFTNRWDFTEAEWQDALSGKDNMNFSSDRVIAGQPTLTKGDVPTWA